MRCNRDRFVLKGALLITTWFVDPHRPTRDLDLLGFVVAFANGTALITTGCDMAEGVGGIPGGAGGP